MANISKVKVPSDANAYLLCDENGRRMIATNYATGQAYETGDFVIYENELYRITADISAGSNTSWAVVSKEGTSVGGEIKAIKAAATTGIHYRGTTTTALVDGATTNPIQINGNSYTAVAGDLVIYDGYEYLFDGTYWEKFGTDGTLKALAFADTASGSATVNSSGSTSGVAVTMTPDSSNQQSVSKMTSAGSMPTFEMGTGANAETLIISAGSIPTYTDYTVLKSLPTPSVTQGSVSVSGTATITVTPDA